MQVSMQSKGLQLMLFAGTLLQVLPLGHCHYVSVGEIDQDGSSREILKNEPANVKFSGGQSPVDGDRRKRIASTNLGRANHERPFDRELIESLTREEFLAAESELVADFLQEQGNLIAALFGGDYESRAGSSTLENRVRVELSRRAKRRSQAADGGKTRHMSRAKAGLGDHEQRSVDPKDLLTALGFYTARDVAVV